MTETLKLPYYTVSSAQLANWLDSQPEAWWSVDGDPLLTSRVDFPCPSSELSSELRQIDKKRLRIYDPRPGAKSQGEPISGAEIDDLADTGNNPKAKTFLLCWDDEDIQWLLVEDPQATEATD